MNSIENFSTTHEEIIRKIQTINPVEYGKTRNYADGSVSRLSPYISRGVISTRQIAESICNRGYSFQQSETLLKQLAWRDYFQQVWISKEDALDSDLKQVQQDVENRGIPFAVMLHKTGIDAVDAGIRNLFSTGYMHNHMRMYVASICCNVAKSHWLLPAKWMHYHLLDADWASNALSWQWVAGTFSQKKYVANQENINRFFNTNQRNTFLDVSYEMFENMKIPDILKTFSNPDLKTDLPATKKTDLTASVPTFIYNFYNLDYCWESTMKGNRILLLEPSFFKRYPICPKTMDFILKLASDIPSIQIIVGEFDEVFKNHHAELHFKEHPTNRHYKGKEHPRTWMFEEVTGYYPSFFQYWKQCQKYISKFFPN